MVFQRLFGRSAPAWCSFFSRREYAAFLERVHALAQKQGFEASSLDEETGRYTQGEATFSARAVALQMRGVPLSRFDEAFALQQRGLDEGMQFAELITRVREGTGALEDLKPCLRVSVQDRRASRAPENLLMRPLAGELIEVIGLRGAHATNFLLRESVARLGLSDEAWFEEARALTRESLQDLEQEALPDEEAVLFRGVNASALLALGAEEGNRAALWVIPTSRTAIRVLPSNGIGALIAASHLKELASDGFSAGPYPLSDEVYVRKNGDVSVIGLDEFSAGEGFAVVDSDNGLVKLMDAFGDDPIRETISHILVHRPKADSRHS